MIYLFKEYTNFLSSDIKSIQKDNESSRPPKKNISIKTTKLNGRWLDIPGAQLSHSDLFMSHRVVEPFFNFR